MSELSKNKYKEINPSETVHCIKSALDSLNLEMDEIWAPANIIGTYSLRLVIKGTTIGTNGKGMSREYAQASAYAEFMERLQNVKLLSNATFYNYLWNNQSDFNIFPDEKRISMSDWMKENNEFYQLLIQEFKLEGADEKETEKNLSVIQKLDYSIFDSKDMLCLPYYSIKERKCINLPYFSMSIHYGSNGMCAGNSPYEALVQGLSEIVERLVQKKIILEKVRFPDIPEDYLKRYDDIYYMYKAMKKSDKFNVFIKDCSCGGKYPAAALILVEKNTGYFGVKVGCSPDYQIALERLFTEAAQGMDIEDYARKTVIDFDNKNVFNDVNILNGFRTGNSRYPYQLFSDEYDYEFTVPKDVTNMSNQEICSSLIDLFIVDGYDVLIRNVSNLGFPSFHIIVPGCSEMKSPARNDYEADHTRFHVEKLLNHPEMIDKTNYKYAVQVIDYYKNALNINKLRDLSGFLPDEDFPAKEYGLDSYYFAGMCYVVAGDYKNAYAVLHNINSLINMHFQKEDHQLKMIENYLCGMKVLEDHKKVISYLSRFYDEKCIAYLDNIFSSRKDTMVKQYVQIDIDGIRKGTCKNCPSYLAYERMNQAVRAVQRKHVIDQQSVSKLFVKL